MLPNGNENEASDFMATFSETPDPVETPAPAPTPAVETPAPAAAAPVQPAPVAGSVPALPVEPKPAAQPQFVTREQLEERERVQRLERENEELRSQQEQPQIPDPKTDPEGYREYERQVQNVTILNERLNMSEMFARDKHGDERIDTVQKWFTERSKTDPQLFQRVMQSRNPYGEAIKEYDNEQLLKSFSDPEERKQYDEWKKSRANPPAPGGSPPAASTTPQPTAPAVIPQPPAIPTSIAAMPSAGQGGLNAIPIGNGQAFDSTFAN